MTETPAPERSEAAAYAEFVHQLYHDDPDLVERSYELEYFGTPCWCGSPQQRVDHAIETDSSGPPHAWLFLPDYSSSAG